MSTTSHYEHHISDLQRQLAEAKARTDEVLLACSKQASRARWQRNEKGEIMSNIKKDLSVKQQRDYYHAEAVSLQQKIREANEANTVIQRQLTAAQTKITELLYSEACLAEEVAGQPHPGTALLAELTALREAAARMEWQEIETAPKDGERIILANTLFSCCGFWDDETESEGGQCWRKDDGYTERLDPTHWMPIPAPPAAKETK